MILFNSNRKSIKSSNWYCRFLCVIQVVAAPLCHAKQYNWRGCNTDRTANRVQKIPPTSNVRCQTPQGIISPLNIIWAVSILARRHIKKSSSSQRHFPKITTRASEVQEVFKVDNQNADAIASIYWLTFSFATWVASAFLVAKKLLTQPKVSLLTTRAVAIAALPWPTRPACSCFLASAP